MRFPGANRHPRRAGATLQYLSRSLAFYEDSGSASIADLSITGLSTDSSVGARRQMDAALPSSTRSQPPDLLA